MVLGEEQPVAVIVGIVIVEWGQHLVSPESGVSTRGTGRVANVNGVMLREGGWGPGNVVLFMLTGTRPEIKDSPPQERKNDGVLEGGDDAGMDSSVHEPILNGVETISEDIIVLHDTHVTHNSHRCLICMSGWQREEVSQLSFCLFVYVSI